MPGEVVVHAKADPRAQTSLWNDGQSDTFLTVHSSADLAPPRQSGVFNIYGICHEMGHLVMYRRCRQLGLPDGIAEGWADYAGSFVTDRVYARLGSDVWPVPYDFRADGMARLRGQSVHPEDAIGRAGAVFCRADSLYGANKVFAAMNEATAGRPYGAVLMPRFVDALAKSTGDGAARTLFPPELLTPQIRWKTQEREITDRSVEGLAVVRDADGLLLKYDSGESDGKRSTAGAGHAVVFKRPKGDWAIDAVEMYGSRYGAPVPPRATFSIFLCDQAFNVVKEIEEPYSRLTYSDRPAWNRIDFGPVRIPEAFYACVYFDPTGNRGFYMHYEAKHRRKHSRSALPWSFVEDVDYDWMIRVHIRSAE